MARKRSSKRKQPKSTSAETVIIPDQRAIDLKLQCSGTTSNNMQQVPEPLTDVSGDNLLENAQSILCNKDEIYASNLAEECLVPKAKKKKKHRKKHSGCNNNNAEETLSQSDGLCCPDKTPVEKKISCSEFSKTKSITNMDQEVSLGCNVTTAESRSFPNNTDSGSWVEQDLSAEIGMSSFQEPSFKTYQRKRFTKGNSEATGSNDRASDNISLCNNVKLQNAESFDHNYEKAVVRGSSDFVRSCLKVEASCVIGKASLERSINDCHMEGRIPSSNVDAMHKDVMVGVTNKEDDHMDSSFLSPKSALVSNTRRKLLILDLNGLLADIVLGFPEGYIPDTMISRKALFKRPFCDDFLRFCFERFDVGVWSSRHKNNVTVAVDFLMGELKHKLLFCWDQSHCTQTGFSTVENIEKPLVLKELKKLWDKQKLGLPWKKGEYDESNTLLLDDSPYKALRNPPYSAIFPKSYTFRDKNDDSLGPNGDLRLYLKELATSENVQKYVEEHPFGQRAITSKNPSWRYYLKVIGSWRSYW